MEFAEGLTELMDAAARGEAGPELLSRCCGPGLRARRVKRGERILHAGFPIRSVRIMLSGRCHVLTISRDGRSFIAYVNEGFQIYGLTELLCGGEAFSASITAEEDCLFAEADARRFCALLENSGGFSGVVLRYLASLVERAMQTGFLQESASWEISAVPILLATEPSHAMVSAPMMMRSQAGMNSQMEASVT